MRALLPKWVTRVATIDEVAGRHGESMTALAAGAQREADAARARHDERVTKAEARLAREKVAAQVELEAALEQVERGRRDAVAEMTARFDAGCREALGLPPDFWISESPGRLELRYGRDPRPLGTADNGGSGGWSTTGSPAGRTFHGSGPAAAIAARRALWALAASVPSPA